MRFYPAISVCFALSACVPTSEAYLWKDGATTLQISRQSTECEVASLNKVPASNQVGTTPSYTTPTQTYCTGYGYSASCTTTGGQTYGGNTYSYDANADLRQRVFNMCMQRNGYRSVTVPTCTADQTKAGRRVSSLNRLPVLDNVVCRIHNKEEFVVK